MDGKVAMHFGRCDTYTFLEEDGRPAEVIENTSSHKGGSGLPPQLMKEHGADVLLCKGIGGRAISLCNELGIEVYVCQAGTVREIFDKWKRGSPAKAGPDDACGHEH